MSDLLNNPIFEIAPGHRQYGKREFVGYMQSHLIPNVPFITFNVRGDSCDEVRDELNALMAKYISNCEGNIHWRHQTTFDYDTEATEKKWRAVARLVVHPYTPKVGL